MGIQQDNGIRKRIAEAIETSGVTQADVARALGISSSAVSQWMSRVKFLRPHNLVALADLTGFNIRWIATGKGPKRPPKPLSPEEEQLVDTYRGLPSPELREQLKDFAQFLAAKEGGPDKGPFRSAA